MNSADPEAPEHKSHVRKCFAVAGITFLLILIGLVGYGVMHAINRFKQIGTAGDIKTVAVSVNDYRNITGHYPVAGSIDELMNILTPKYLSFAITKDGWNNKLRYEAFEGDPKLCLPMPAQQPAGCGPVHFFLASGGADGQFEKSNLSDYNEHDVRQFRCDIVFRDYQFVLLQSGKQEFGKCTSP